MTPLKNTITRCRIKFCTQYKQLESQHSFKSEYQQEILESAANFSYAFRTYSDRSLFGLFSDRETIHIRLVKDSE